MAAATEFRGRGDELDALSEMLAAAHAGSGRVALIEGEAGIGKTRLLDELAARSEALDVPVRRAAAQELEQDRAYGALVEAFGAPDMLPTLGTGGLSGGADARSLAQDAFIDHVERLTATGPLLLAVDDLHWADRGTLATLGALVRRSTELGLVLAGAFRPTPQPPELSQLVAGCTRVDALHLRLGPIPHDALAALATDVMGAPVGPALLDGLRGARGNPFVAIELLRALDTEGGLADVDGARELTAVRLSPALRETLLPRVTRLSEETQRVLEVAAVLGDTGRLQDVAALLDRSVAQTADAIADATRAGLLEPAGVLVAFRHDLIREAVYDDLPEAVRAGWHREAARRLDGHAEPSVVARHLALGAIPGDADAVQALQRLAADLAASEPDAAAELLARALELALDQARPELGVARARTLLSAGRAEEAILQADEVVASRAASPADIARAQIARANAAFHQGQPAEAVRGFAAARATGALDETATAFALAHEATNRMWSFELDAALELAERALAEGRRLGITSVQVEALAARCGVYAFRAEPDPGIVAGREAVELAGDDRTALRRTPHVFLGLALLAGDRGDEARHVVDEGRRRALAHGQVIILRSYDLTLARIAWFAGRWDDALAEADTAARVAEDFGVRFGLVATEGVKGLLAFHRGEHAAARASLERQQATRPGSGNDASGSELFVLLQARLLEASGRLDEAVTTLLDFFEVTKPLGMNAARLWPGPVGVRLALAARKAGDASAIAADLDAIAERAGTGSARAAASFARGLIDADAARLADAAAGFATAGRPLDQLEALEAAGSVHIGAGERDAAVGCLRGALSIAERLGASHDARRIGAALRELGARIGSRGGRGRPATGWQSLTTAEREVARLIDDGLRNAEIAEQLFVSRRTVEGHVSRMYAKLKVDNRVALVNTVREHLGPPVRGA